MKWVKIIGLILLVSFVGIQFVPTERNQSIAVPNDDFIKVNKPPSEISAILKESCYDCHSNNTKYPWYNKIQPVAWFLEDHIKQGKDELNFNTWNELSNRKKRSKLKSIINQIKDGEMPLSSYTMIHRHAILNGSEKGKMIDYMNLLMKSNE